jgi:hypothetical protein
MPVRDDDAAFIVQGDFANLLEFQKSSAECFDVALQKVRQGLDPKPDALALLDDAGLSPLRSKDQ